MFSILRFILIIGVIFYYSPVRDRGETTDPLLDFVAPRTAEGTEPATRSATDHAAPGHLETAWQALPEGAKQAVVEKILNTSGLTPTAPKASDTLKPEDRAPSALKPRG